MRTTGQCRTGTIRKTCVLSNITTFSILRYSIRIVVRQRFHITAIIRCIITTIIAFTTVGAITASRSIREACAAAKTAHQTITCSHSSACHKTVRYRMILRLRCRHQIIGAKYTTDKTVQTFIDCFDDCLARLDCRNTENNKRNRHDNQHQHQRCR